MYTRGGGDESTIGPVIGAAPPRTEHAIGAQSASRSVAGMTHMPRRTAPRHDGGQRVGSSRSCMTHYSTERPPRSRPGGEFAGP